MDAQLVPFRRDHSVARTFTTPLPSIAFLGAAIGIRWLLDPLMGPTLPLVTMFGAVAFSVWSAGVRISSIVALVGYLACAYLFIEPRGTFGVSGIQNSVGLIAYIFTSSIIIGFGEATRRAQFRVAEQGERLRTTRSCIGDGVITTDADPRAIHGSNHTGHDESPGGYSGPL